MTRIVITPGIISVSQRLQWARQDRDAIWLVIASLMISIASVLMLIVF